MAVFRDVTVTDAAAHALLSDYFAGRAETFPGGPDAYRTVFPNEADFVAPNGVFIVADGDAPQLGCGGIRLAAPSPEGAVRYEVKHVFVRPEGRGQGLGRQLLLELERRAAEFGAQEIVLDTNASQLAAARLYESLGYESIAPYNDNPNATHWYRKRLR